MREGYKKTEIGVIPVEWEIVKLEKGCTRIIGGGTPSKNNDSYWNNGTILWATPTEFTKNNNRFISTTTLKITQEGLENSSATLLKEGTVIMSSRATIGECKINTIEMTTNQGFISYECNQKLNNVFLLYLIGYYKNRIIKVSSGSTFLEVSRTTMRNFKIPLPPLKEQKEIANILSTADKKIEAIELQIQKAQTLKKGLLQKLLSEGIGHSEFKDSELGRIPVGWEVVELDTVAKLNKQKYTPIESESINYIGLEHINQEQGTINGVGCSTDTLSQKNCFNKGEILFGKLRPYLRKFYLADIDGVCSTEILVIKAKDNILNSILFQIIMTESFIEHSISKVFGTKMPRTSWAILKEFKLALPPLKEQKQIAQILSTSDEKIELLRAKKEKYETLKKGLLQKLLSGEVRVGCCP